MYTIYVDGTPINELFSDSRLVTEPKLTVEMGKAGSVEFNIPATNPVTSDLIPLKTKIRIEVDGEELFDGRVLSKNRNFYNMKKVTCEGNLAYLVDSQQKGEKFVGKTHDFFRKVIENHNKRVEAEKQFAVGSIGIENRDIVVAGQSEEIEDLETGKFDYKQIAINGVTDNWKTSFDYIDECLIQYCGGYLRTRKANGTTYIDLITDYGNTSVQEIEFGVNLLDLTEETSVDEIFTVLIPLGDENLDITSVNNGSDELVDEEGVKRYGRIVKTHVFSGVNTAETLLENGKRFLENQDNIPSTFSVRAIDFHFIDPDVTPIHCGDKVHVNSKPHGVCEYMTCTRIEYDLENPENTVYTFGIPHQTLTERYRKDKKKDTSGGGGAAGDAASEDIEDELEKFFDAWIDCKPDSGNITLGATAKLLEDTRTILQQMGITLDAPTGNINIQILRKDIDDVNQRTIENSAQINMLTEDTESSIQMLVSQTTKLEELQTGHYAEFTMRAGELESSINAKADKVTVEGIETEIKAHLEGIDSSLALKANGKDVEELEGRVTETETATADLTTRIGDAETSLSQKAESKTVTELSGKVTNIESAQSDLTTRVGSTETSLSQKAESSAVTALDGRVSNISSAQASLTTRVGSAEARLEQCVTDIDGLSKSITTINSDIVNINANVTTITGNFSVANGQLTVLGPLVAARGLHVGSESFNVFGQPYSGKPITVVTSFTQALGEQAPTKKLSLLASIVKTETTVDALPGETVSFAA